MIRFDSVSLLRTSFFKNLYLKLTKKDSANSQISRCRKKAGLSVQ